MRAWISGGSGFVGGHLVEAFDDVAATLGVDLPVGDEQLRRLERSLTCTRS